MLFNISKLVLTVFLSAFVATALLDPADQILHLKMPLFTLVVSVWAVRVACGMVSPGSPHIWAAIVLFALVLPGIATIVGLLGDSLPGGDPSGALLKGFIVIALIPVVSSEGIDLTKHIVGWSFFVAALTIGLAILSFVNPLIFTTIYQLTLAKGNAAINQGDDKLGLGIGSFYYMTVSVLVFPIAYHCRELIYGPKKMISLLLITLFLGAVLCSGSRATVLGAFIVVAAIAFQKFQARFGVGAALSVLLIALAIPSFYFHSFFKSTDSSNAIKLGHVRSYAEEFNDQPTYLLWGQGADTEFYSQGFGKKTVMTELSYIELIRQFGIPITVLFVIALFYPVVELTRRTNSASYLAIPYCVYLCEAGTNPLLIGSTGLLMVSAVWGVVLMHNVARTIVVPREALS